MKVTLAFDLAVLSVVGGVEEGEHKLMQKLNRYGVRDHPLDLLSSHCLDR